MRNKKVREKSPTGDDIQIKYDRHYKDDYYTTHYLILKVVALNFQSAIDDEWQGTWKNQPIWVKFTRPGHMTIFSDNFPEEHKDAAFIEVRRIERKFD